MSFNLGSGARRRHGSVHPHPVDVHVGSRVRAVEEGLPLVRDGNNGISAIFDPYGRIREHLDLDTIGVLDVALPRPLQPTLYASIGDSAFAGMIGVILVFAVARGWRRRARPDLNV